MWWKEKQILDEEIKDSNFHLAIGLREDIEDFLNNFKSSSPYHFPLWHYLIKKTFKFDTINFYIQNNENIITYLPLTFIKSLFFGKYFVSVGFADTGGVLSKSRKAMEILFKEVESFCKEKGAKFVEIRNSEEIISSFFVNKKEKVLSFLLLPESEEKLWKNFDAKLRNQIRKAQRSNLDVSFDKEKIKDFHKVYSRNMRYLGSPHLPLSFFKNLVNIYKEKSEVIVLYKGNVPVGGAVGIYHNNTLEVPWASSRRDYFKYCPNNLIYWELLKKSIKNSVEVFSFGRSTINSSTHKFKKQWGAEDFVLNYSYLKAFYKENYNLSPINPKFSIAVKLWKIMPLFFTRLMGPIIAKGLG